jgi:RNA polymerase sigma-70 factor, ECF subfamily
MGAENADPAPIPRGSGDERTRDVDAALIRRVATADRGAMHLLFSRHHLAVYRFVLLRLQHKALAEDVTSEVFLDVWRNAGRFDNRFAALTWILAIARHKAFTAKPRIQPGCSSAAASDDDRVAVLRRCMTRLSAEHREVMDLVYYQEQSIDSVATILSIARGTARMRVLCARRLGGRVEKVRPRLGCCPMSTGHQMLHCHSPRKRGTNSATYVGATGSPTWAGDDAAAIPSKLNDSCRGRDSVRD